MHIREGTSRDLHMFSYPEPPEFCPLVVLCRFTRLGREIQQGLSVQILPGLCSIPTYQVWGRTPSEMRICHLSDRAEQKISVGPEWFLQLTLLEEKF
jgi:hypothetical protein